ncbi:MAG: ABC transporter permease [Gemmatimonadetes bacterium]|nr:ABC transporter permease [Gemmatimonadota bacterium]
MRRSLEAWTRDFMHAARALRRAPGFTVVTVATLALAIGSNAAIFSVVDTVLLDPLDFPAADRLVVIRASAPGTDQPDEFGPGAEFYVQYRDNAGMLEDLGMWNQGQTTVRSDERTERLFIVRVTPDLYTTLGVTPMLGRLSTTEDGSADVMVISHWLWTTWFDADPSVVGRSYEVSGTMRTVIGVMGPEFRFPDDRTALWIHAMFQDESEIRPGNFGFNFVGRMTPGTDHASLEGQLAILASRLPELYGGSARYAEIIEQHVPIVRSLEEELVGDIAGRLWLLMGAVVIVLLIACANVANLFIVRAESRRGDLAVRQALGAGRAGLIRTQMAEALLLAAAGGVGAALLAWAAVPLLVRAAPENIPNLDAASLDFATLIFTAGVSILAALAFGLLPAIRFSRPRPVGASKQAGRGWGAGGHWSRNALVLLQTAAALVLLVGSGLLIRSFWTLTHVDAGFDTDDIFTFQVAPQREELNDGPSYARFHEAFMERVAGLPSVESVGLTLALPLDEGAADGRFNTMRTLASGEAPPILNFTAVGGDYFRTMGIAITRGRRFEPSDHRLGTTPIIVSESMAELLWPGEDPFSGRLLPGPDSTAIGWMNVVGVAEDIFLNDFRQDARDPMLYLPMVGPTADAYSVGSPAYVVKTRRAEVIGPEIRALMREVIPESPMYRIFTMEGLAQRSMAQLSFTMLMLTIASGLALILAAVGLYGVLSYVVAHRAPEIAMRMALGAEASQVRRMVVLQGARVALAGVALGLAAAFALTRVLDSLLFGVGTLDLLTFAATAGVMLMVALLASYIPARRASLVSPMLSLRSE